MAMIKGEKAQKIIQMVQDAYRSSKDDTYRAYREEVWNRCYDSWRSRLTKRIPRKSNLFIPITFQTIDTMIAREMSAIYNESGVLFKFNPRQSKHLDASDTLSAYANYDLCRVPHSYKKMQKERLMNHIYGNAILRVFWDYDFVPTIGKNNEGEDVPFLNVTRDQFNFENVSPRNFFPDPVAKNLDECKWVITRTLVDTDEYVKQMEQLEWSKLTKEEIQQVSVQGGIGFYDDFHELEHRDSLTMDKNRKFVEVLEYWNKGDDRYVVVAGEKFVVRDDPIPFAHKKYPFIVDVDIPDPEEFWGISTVELIHDLQAELNSIRNNRMDKWNFVTNPMWKAKHGTLFNRTELVSRPGGMVHLRDMKDLERLPMGDTTQSDYQEEAICKNDIQNASSISDYSMGFSEGLRNETATGISIISSNADSKIIAKIQYMQEEVLKPLGLMWLSLQQQFGKDKEIFYSTGKNWTFSKEMLFHPYELKILASTQLVNKTVRQNQMLQLTQIALNNPYVNQGELLKLIFDTYGIDAGKLIVQGQPQMGGGGPQNTQGAGQPTPNAGAQAGAPIESQGYDFIQGKQV